MTPTVEKRFEKIQKITEKQLAEEIGATIKKVQTKYNTDIFGFGNYIYKSDPKLWRKINSDWNVLFTNMEVEIKPQITIENSALMR